MTISQDVYPPAQPLDAPLSGVAGRPLAGAIAVFLGAYLLLMSMTGRLSTVAQNVVAQLADRPQIQLMDNEGALYVSQFLFALAVIIVGLFLSGGSPAARLAGSILVVVVAIVTLAMIGISITGAVPLPGREAGLVVRAVFANPWFSVPLSVGIAWLFTRRAGVGWTALLGTALLGFLPTALQFANVEYGTRTLVLLAVSAVVGAAIMVAGRPLRA